MAWSLFALAFPWSHSLLGDSRPSGRRDPQRRRAAAAVLTASSELAGRLRECYLPNRETEALGVDDLVPIYELAKQAIDLIGPMVEGGRRWTIGEVVPDNGLSVDPVSRLAALLGDSSGRTSDLGNSVLLLVDHAIPNLFSASGRIAVANGTPARVRAVWDQLVEIGLRVPQSFATSVNSGRAGQEVKTFEVATFYAALSALLRSCGDATRHALDEFVPGELGREERIREKGISALNRKWG